MTALKMTASEREEFFLEQRWLVHHILKRYILPSSISFEDAVQAGYYGLWRAIASDNFDENRSKWSTYAGRAIQNEINRFITTESSSDGFGSAPYIRQVAYSIYKLDEEGYTDDQIAEELGLKEENVDAYRRLDKSAGQLICTDEFGDTYENPLLPTIEDDDGWMFQNDFYAFFDEAGECLSDREWRVITSHCGLYGNEPKTFQEVSEEEGVSRQAADNAYRRGLRKLAKYADEHPLAGEIKEYL